MASEIVRDPISHLHLCGSVKVCVFSDYLEFDQLCIISMDEEILTVTPSTHFMATSRFIFPKERDFELCTLTVGEHAQITFISKKKNKTLFSQTSAVQFFISGNGQVRMNYPEQFNQLRIFSRDCSQCTGFLSHVQDMCLETYHSASVTKFVVLSSFTICASGASHIDIRAKGTAQKQVKKNGPATRVHISNITHFCADDEHQYDDHSNWSPSGLDSNGLQTSEFDSPSKVTIFGMLHEYNAHALNNASSIETRNDTHTIIDGYSHSNNSLLYHHTYSKPKSLNFHSVAPPHNYNTNTEAILLGDCEDISNYHTGYLNTLSNNGFKSSNSRRKFSNTKNGNKDHKPFRTITHTQPLNYSSLPYTHGYQYSTPVHYNTPQSYYKQPY